MRGNFYIQMGVSESDGGEGFFWEILLPCLSSVCIMIGLFVNRLSCFLFLIRCKNYSKVSPAVGVGVYATIKVSIIIVITALALQFIIIFTQMLSLLSHHELRRSST